MSKVFLTINSDGSTINKTPSSRWKEEGLPDLHNNNYDCERAKLCMGNLTDDELANAAYMNYDVFPKPEDIIAGKAYSPIAYMTAVKDRIRWLSRALEKEIAKNKNVNITEVKVISLLDSDIKRAKDMIDGLRYAHDYYNALDKTFPVTYERVVETISKMIGNHVRQLRDLETKKEILNNEPHH